MLYFYLVSANKLHKIQIELPSSNVRP